LFYFSFFSSISVHRGHPQLQRCCGSRDDTDGGATKSADVDYFASLDSTNHQLWLTLKGSFSGSTPISIAGGPPSSRSTQYLPVVCREC
jgi:hypothetical protein